MATPVEKIKERLSIVDVVSSYVTLQKAGKNYKAKSPFTNEKTPSFYVSPDRGMYYCFSSSKGGDIFTFIEEMEGVDFKGALKILAERAGVELTPEDPHTRTEREQLYAILESATQFFENRLKQSGQASAYLTDRGVTPESLALWRIGYAPDEWRMLKEYLLERNFPESLIARTGLIKRSEENQNAYDTFRDRIMFPICDASGRVVAFSGRRLSNDPASPKYVNSPETELFSKSEILFGYHRAKSGIRSYDFSLIVEGQFDLVLSHQVGYTNTVAISGTALSPQHVALLQRLSNRAVLALDSDTAGIASVKRSASLMLARGMDVKVARIVGGKDPADLAHEDPALLKRAIGSATHVIEFLIAVLRESITDERAFRLKVRDEVIPFIVAIPNKIDQEFFEKKVAEAIDTTQAGVHYEVERFVASAATERNAPPDTAAPAAPDAPPRSESVRQEDMVAHLFGVLMWQEGSAEPRIDPKKLRGDLARVLGTESIQLLEDWPAEAKSAALFKVEALYAGEDGQRTESAPQNLGRSVEELLNELYVRRLKASLAEAKAKLLSAERAGDAAGLEETLAVCHAIQKQLSESAVERPFQYTESS